MGKMLIIKGANFSQNAIDNVAPAGDLVVPFLKGKGRFHDRGGMEDIGNSDTRSVSKEVYDIARLITSGYTKLYIPNNDVHNFYASIVQAETLQSSIGSCLDSGWLFPTNDIIQLPELNPDGRRNYLCITLKKGANGTATFPDSDNEVLASGIYFTN